MKLKMSMVLEVDDTEQSIEALKQLKFAGVKSISDLDIEPVKDNDAIVSVQTQFGRLEAYSVEDELDGYTGIAIDLIDDDNQRLTIVKCEQEPHDEVEGAYELKSRTFSGDNWEDVSIMDTNWLLPKKAF